MNRKTAIITGATKGIGKALAYQFLKNGYDISICARTLKDLEDLKEVWTNEFPNQTIMIAVADFENEASVSSFAQLSIDTFKHIDILINNAGIFLPGTVLEEPFDSFNKQMLVNVNSSYIMSRIIASNMQQRKSGHIFNICSVASIAAYAGGTSYGISKYAMLGMSDNFREALKPFKVKVTAVLPGPTQSFSWEGTGIDFEKLMPAEDLAHLIYQCSQISFNVCVDKLVITPCLDL
ncbi:MAG TPA: SDR family NAD(P)-dependent oxidoreductase [Edaphocola sp.]|nr:SDR family NAD(P)-dependent oxidoreductase [Edaphocola sp.]